MEFELDDLLGDLSRPEYKRAESAPELNLNDVNENGQGKVATVSVQHVAWTHDDELLITVGDEPPVRVWNVASGQLLKEMERTTQDDIRGVTCTYDSKYIAAVDSYSRLCIWEYATGRCILEESLSPKFQHGWKVEFSPRSGYRLLCALDNQVAIVDFSAGFTPSAIKDQVTRFLFPDTTQRSVYGLTWSLDERLIACSTGAAKAYAWAVVNPAQAVTLDGHSSTDVYDVAISHDSSLIASVAVDQTVRVYRVNSVEPLNAGFACSIAGHTSMLMSVKFDGTKRLVTAGGDETVRLWGLQTETGSDSIKYVPEIVFTGHNEFVNFANFSWDGTRVATAADDNRAMIFEANKIQYKQNTYGVGGPDFVRGRMMNIAWLDEKVFVTCGRDGVINLFDIEQNTCSRVFRSPRFMLFSLATVNNYIFVTHHTEVFVCRRDPETNEVQQLEEKTFRFGPENTEDKYISTVCGAVIDGKTWLICTTIETRKIYMVCMESDDTIVIASQHTLNVAALSVSRDQQKLATGSEDLHVRIWSLPAIMSQYIKYKKDGMIDGQTALEYASVDCEGHSYYVHDVAWSPSSTHVVSASADKTVRVWTLDGRCILSKSFQEEVYRVDWSPKGSIIATTFKSGSIHLLSIEETINEFDVLYSSDAQDVTFPCYAKFDPTGHHLMTGVPGGPGYAPRGFLVDLREPASTEVWKACFNKKLFSTEQDRIRYIEGASFNPHRPIQGKNRKTLLHLAVEHRDVNAIRTLLTSPRVLQQSGVFFFPKDDAGKTALDLALESRFKEGLASMLEHACNIGVPIRQRGCLLSVLPEMTTLYQDLLLSTLESLKPVPVPVEVSGSVTTFNLKDHEFLTLGSNVQAPNKLWPTSISNFAVDLNVVEQPVEALVAPLPGITAYMDARKPVPSSMAPTDFGEILNDSQDIVQWKPIRCRSLLHSLVNADFSDPLESELMRAVLEYKWHKFAKYEVFRQALRYILFTVAFTIMAVFGTVEDDRCAASSNEGEPLYRRILGHVSLFVLSFIISIVFLGFEVQQFFHERSRYFSNFWNWLDWLTYFLIATLVVLRLTCAPVDALECISAVAVIFLWFKLLEYARAFEATGKFVRIMFRIVRAIRSFLVVLAIVVVGFAAGFYLLFRSEPEVEEIADYKTWRVVLLTYTTMLGELDTNALQLSSSEVLASIVFFVYTGLVSIILLNLLIALMSAVYENVDEKGFTEWLLERAKLIVEVEQTLKPQPENYPFFLHVLRPCDYKTKGADVRAEEVLAEVNRLREQLTREQHSNEKHLDKQLQEHRNRIQELIKVHDKRAEAAEERQRELMLSLTDLVNQLASSKQGGDERKNEE